MADAACTRVKALRGLWRDPVLRLAAGLLVVIGLLWSSFGPFVARLTVDTFALGDRGNAAVLAVFALVGVVAPVWMGIRADQKAGAAAAWALAVVGLGSAGPWQWWALG